jgi:hypothetical protein
MEQPEPNTITHTPEGKPRCVYCGHPLFQDLPSGYSPQNPPLHQGCVASMAALLRRLRGWGVTSLPTGGTGER